MIFSKLLCLWTILLSLFISLFQPVHTILNYNDDVLEKPQDLSVINGYLDVYIGESFGMDEDKTIIVLRNSSDDSLYQLKFNSKFPGTSQLTSGMNVLVKGFISNTPSDVFSDNYKRFDVESIDIISNSNSLELSTRMNKKLFSETITRKIAIILINFKDQDLECSRDYIENLIWGNSQSSDYGSLKKSVEVNSFGKVVFSKHSESNSDIFGPYTINYRIKKSDKCEPDLWANEALTIARISGLSLKDYNHIMYILPSGKQKELCGWYGLAQLGCPYKCTSWISLCREIGVYIHEIGHNLGFHHSSSYDFSTEDLKEYGDPVGIMGNAFYRGKEGDIFYFNAIHRINSGWIESTYVQTVNTTGIYKTSPFNMQPQYGKPQAIKIIPPYKLSTSNGNVTAEFILSFLSGDNVKMKEVCFVHMSFGSGYPSYSLETLSLNGVKSWRDPHNIFSVRLIDINSEEMVIKVIFNCIYSAPLIKLKESSSYILSPPNTKVLSNDGHEISDTSNFDVTQHVYIKENMLNHTFTFEIENRDSEVCPSSIFKYQYDVDSDTMIQCDKADLYLYPQQSCSLTCLISSTSLNDVTSLNIRFNDINYLYNPNLHHVAYNLNLLNESLCWNAGIDFLNEIDLLETYIDEKISNLNILSLKNYDSSACSKRSILINMYFIKDDDNEHINIETDLEMILYPQEIRTLFLNTKSPDSVGDWKLLINLEESDNLYKQIEIPVIVMDKCKRGNIHVNYESNAELFARSGGRIVFTVNNNDDISCPPENLRINASALSSNVDVSVFPNSIINLKPNEKSEFYVIATVSDYILSTQTSKIVVTVTGDNYYINEQKYSIDVTINPVTCEENEPLLYTKCLDEVLGVYENKTYNSTSTTCAIIWKNRNTIPCKGSFYSLDIDISFSDDIDDVDVTYNLENSIFEALPQNSSSHQFELKINSRDILPHIQYDTVTMYVDIILTDITRSMTTSTQMRITIGLCKMENPILTVDDNSLNMFAGSKRSLTLSIENNNPIFCGKHLYTVEINNQNEEYIKIEYEPIVNIMSKRTKDIQLKIDASKESVGNYNFEIIVKDLSNPEFYSSVEIEIEVDNSCEVDKPSISSDVDSYKLNIGESKQLNYPLKFKNTDSKGCPVTEYNIYLWDNDLPVILATDDPIIKLHPQDETQSNILIDVPDYLSPGNYSVFLTTSDGEEIAHFLNYSLNFEIKCPIPKPVQYIEVEEITHFIGASVDVNIKWKSCQTPSDCCCPCKWEIYNHDKLIGTTNKRKFTYSPSIFQTGVGYNFSIHVIDKFGTRSSLNTCGFTKYKYIGLKPFEYILIALFVFVMLSIPAVVIYRMIKIINKNDKWEEYIVKVY